MNQWGRDQIGVLSEDAFLAAGVALYAGEGGKTDGRVTFANCDPNLLRYFLSWLRNFFEVDESRLRVCLYLHEGLDLASAIQFWSDVTGVPASQFGKPYRAVPDATIHHNKHVHGLARIDYCCAKTHRGVMGLVRALLASRVLPG